MINIQSFEYEFIGFDFNVLVFKRCGDKKEGFVFK